MIVGCTKEIKDNEYRVGLTPSNVRDYVSHNHEVLIEKNAGVGAGFSDDQYIKAGANIIQTSREVFDNAEMIVKVKELEEEEYDLMHEDQILYTYLHLAANKSLTEALIDNKIKSVGYETITDKSGFLPCLSPMSQIAGRLSIQEGSKYLEKEFGGRGLLLSGVPGVACGNVVIIGGGIAGTYAAKSACGLGADVTIIDININRLEYLDDIFRGSVTTLYSTPDNISEALKKADLVVGSVLIPGASTPQLIRREHLDIMKNGSVIVDIAIDQGGCAESSHVTTHSDPVYLDNGVVHYCVGNMPGVVPHTSTLALTNATLLNGVLIADYGLEKACEINSGLKNGVNLYDGKCVNYNVSRALNLEYYDFEDIKH